MNTVLNKSLVITLLLISFGTNSTTQPYTHKHDYKYFSLMATRVKSDLISNHNKKLFFRDKATKLMHFIASDNRVKHVSHQGKSL